MNTKKLPIRKCAACGQMKEKNELFRLVKADGEVSLDLTYKADGRGAYVCKDRACIDLAVKKKSFNRALRGPVNTEVIDSLYMELENGCK